MSPSACESRSCCEPIATISINSSRPNLEGSSCNDRLDAREKQHQTWTAQGGEDIAYLSPSDDSVLGHQTLEKLGVRSCHVLSIFLLAERGLAVTTDGETIKSPLLRSVNGYRRLARGGQG